MRIYFRSICVLASVFAIGSCWFRSAARTPSGSSMQAMDRALATIHQAVASGDGPTLRRAASELDHHAQTYVSSSDQLWGHWETLQAQAQKLATVECLEDAAMALGFAAKACGDCHRETGKQILVPTRPFPEGSGSKSRMRRHSWSMNQLRRGIEIPSDEAWLDGTLRVLAGDFGELNADASPASERASENLSALGAAAHDAVTSAAKARFYGLMMRECVACHNQSRDGSVSLDPRDRCTPLL